MLAFATALACAARTPAGGPDRANPLEEARWRAQELFAADEHTDVHQLARERLAVVRAALKAQARQLESGHGVQFAGVWTVLEPSWRDRLLEAELAVSSTAADRFAALERHWQTTWFMHLVAKAQYESASYSIVHYWLAQVRLLRAEMALAQQRPAGGRSAAAGPPEDFSLTEESRLLLHAAWQASLTKPRELALKRIEAARRAQEGLMMQLVSRPYMDPFRPESFRFVPRLLGHSRRLLDAELAAFRDRGDQAAARARYWHRAWLVEDICRARHEAAMLSPIDLCYAKYKRLDAELALRQAPKGRSMPVDLEPVYDPANDSLTTEGLMARALSKVWQTDAEKLALDLRAAAREYIANYFQNLAFVRNPPPQAQAGRVLAFLLDDADRLRECMLAIATNANERLAALRQYWLTTQEVERLLKAGYEKGVLSEEGYLEGRYISLTAEIQWAQAKAAKQKERPGW
jgi:hypothetical protein